MGDGTDGFHPTRASRIQSAPDVGLPSVLLRRETSMSGPRVPVRLLFFAPFLLVFLLASPVLAQGPPSGVAVVTQAQRTEGPTLLRGQSRVPLQVELAGFVPPRSGCTVERDPAVDFFTSSGREKLTPRSRHLSDDGTLVMEVDVPLGAKLGENVFEVVVSYTTAPSAAGATPPPGGCAPGSSAPRRWRGAVEVADLYTGRPFNAHFLAGVESTKESDFEDGGDDFSGLIFHGGLFVLSRLTPDRPDRAHVSHQILLRFRSLTRAVAPEGTPDSVALDAGKAFEFSTGLALRLLPWTLGAPSDVELPAHRVGVSLVARAGGVTLVEDALPAGATAGPEGDNDFFFQYFLGLRLQNLGRAANGAYFDLGWGCSDNLGVDECRWKSEGYLPVTRGRVGTLFVAGRVETDLGDADDDVTFVVGQLLSGSAVRDLLTGLF